MALLLAGAAIWSGIEPYSRTVWYVEMVWAAGVFAILTASYRKFRFSTMAYGCFGAWLLLQIIGAHYSFEKVPMGWIMEPLGLERNPYDRIAHFTVGWFAFPLAELYWRKGWASSQRLAGFFAVMTTVAMAGVWEIVEWLYAAVDGGEAGAAFLGSQGDVWDAQKDILCDTFGAMCASWVFILFGEKSRATAARMILILGAVFALPSGGFAANTALIPVPKLENDNYDWYARHERILKEAKAMKSEIVLIGDSITHHWAGINSIGGDDATPYFKAAFKGKRVLNLGFGWDRIQNMLWRIENGELAGVKPKTVIIMAGTNNMTGTKNARANDAKEIAEGVLALVKNVRRVVPRNAKIVVMGILPRAGKNDPMRKTAKEANGILSAHIKKLAKQEPISFIDLSDKFVDETGERIKALYRDQVHLSPAGYAIWAESIKAFL